MLKIAVPLSDAPLKPLRYKRTPSGELRARVSAWDARATHKER